MTKLTKRVATAIASGAMLLNTVLPAFAQTTIEISGNGTDSTNKVYVDQNNTTGVTQSNTAAITNTVNASASTGGNEAEDNTGGDVTIQTGDATTKVAVENSVNSNQASVDCCSTGPVDLKISGNGTDSYNKIDLDINKEAGKDATTGITQSNVAEIVNNVDAKAKTGYNEAEGNTGGDVKIDTGDAKVKVEIGNTANANSATIGGDETMGSLSARILGNGADSHNKMYIDLVQSALIAQSNSAAVTNDVDAYAKTGYNEAEDNTGGETLIETGDAKVKVGIDNMLNFNWAELDCGCLLGDYLLKIDGNGADTHNKIKVDLEGGAFATQSNVVHSGLVNDVDAYAKTGYNEVEDGTGSVTGDPTIDTGDAVVKVAYENSGNFNGVNGDEMPEWPDFGNMDFQFGFNWAALWAWMSLHW